MLSMTSSERSSGDGPMDVRGPATRSIAMGGAARGTAGIRSSRLPTSDGSSSMRTTFLIDGLLLHFFQGPPRPRLACRAARYARGNEVKSSYKALAGVALAAQSRDTSRTGKIYTDDPQVNSTRARVPDWWPGTEGVGVRLLSN